jgi:CRP-like cAMP-binding protein
MPETFLKRLPFFGGVAEEWLSQLASSAEEKSFGPNSIVFRKDDPCDGLYVIAQGGVVVRNEVVGQPIERVRELGPGDVFGESEAFEGTPRRFSARTLGPTTVYRIPEEPLLSFLREHPEVEMQLRAPVVRRRTARQHALLAPSSRMEPRIWIDREVVVTLDGGEQLELKLENLSTGGACLSAAPGEWRVTKILSFALGTPIRPELVKVSGAVRWRLGDVVGISFDGAGPALRRRIQRAVRELVPEAETL